jgi:hypothetical protein
MALTTPKQLVRALKECSSLKAVMRKYKMSWFKTHALYKEAVKEGLMDRLPMGAKSREDMTDFKVNPGVRLKKKSGQVRVKAALPLEVLPCKDGIRRAVFTYAQNATKLMEPLWTNIHAYLEFYGAQRVNKKGETVPSICVSRGTYVKRGFGAMGDKERWLELLDQGQRLRAIKSADEEDELYWDHRLEPYFVDAQVEVAPGLVFCGESNIIPSKARPLSSKETYTGRRSAIFPHPKYELTAIPSNQSEATKFNFTTGAITLKNYIFRDAGLMARFHHSFGFLLVEWDDEGNWWTRQLNADSTGTIYDVHPEHGVIRVKKGKVTGRHTGHDYGRKSRVYWADPQIVEQDDRMIKVAFGEGGMKDVLRPVEDFMGDVGSFKSRSHWDMQDPFKIFLRWVQGVTSVENEGNQIGDFLDYALRPYCTTHVLDGNHERHIGRWLRTVNGIWDSKNAQIWNKLAGLTLDFIESRQREPNYLEVLLRACNHPVLKSKRLNFMLRNASYVVCPDAGGGAECGGHGDDGPHGTRGSTRSQARGGRKKCLGHAWPEIFDGIYRSSSFARWGLDWQTGETAMNNCVQVFIYPNGKRTLIHFWDGRWCAGSKRVPA